MNAGVKDETGFTGMELAVFKLNDELRVEGSSISPNHLLVSHTNEEQKKRLGDVLQCVNSLETEEGCGFGAACPDCVVRNAISECFISGTVIRKRIEMKLRRDNSSSWHKFIITTNPMSDKDIDYVALIIEDLHTTLSKGGLTLQIDVNKSDSHCQLHNIIEDHLIKYRTVTYQPASEIQLTVDPK